MKKQYVPCLLITVLGLSIWPAANAAAEDKSPIMQQTADPGVILFFLLVVVLAFLALWLLKSSGKLKFMDQAEPDGAEWIGKHLNDLETHQLDKLINRRRPTGKHDVNHSKYNTKK
jgi:hypothetical protein